MTTSYAPIAIQPRTIDATRSQSRATGFPSMNDWMIALAGSVVMAAAGAGIAAYLMLPFNAVG